MRIVLITDSDIYERRADMLYDLFVSQCHSVKVYTTDFSHMQKTKRKDLRPEYNYIETKTYHKNISVARIRSHRSFSRDVLKPLENEKADLLWVLIPPNSLAKTISSYKASHPETKVIFDVIDMWPETMPVKSFKKLPFIKIWANLRNKYIDNADLVVTECNLYQTVLSKYVDSSKMRTLYLAKDPYKDTGSGNPPDDRYSLCYLGSINNIIDIPVICEIVAKFKAVKPVDLHIIGDGENRDLLISSAKDAGANVIYHGKIYDVDKKQEILDSVHFGLNIMKDEVFVGLTMKSMDYFASALPVINNVHGDTWQFIEDNRIGANYDDSFSVEGLGSYDRRDVRAFFADTLSKDHFDQEVASIMQTLFEGCD